MEENRTQSHVAPKKEACLYSIIQNAAKKAPTQPTSRRTEKRLKIYIFLRGVSRFSSPN